MSNGKLICGDRYEKEWNMYICRKIYWKKQSEFRLMSVSLRKLNKKSTGYRRFIVSKNYMYFRIFI